MNNLKKMEETIKKAKMKVDYDLVVLALIKRRVTENWIEGISEEFVETIQEIEIRGHKLIKEA